MRHIEHRKMNRDVIHSALILILPIVLSCSSHSLGKSQCVNTASRRPHLMHVTYVSSKTLAPYRRTAPPPWCSVRLYGASSARWPINVHILQGWSRIGAEMAHKHVV